MMLKAINKILGFEKVYNVENGYARIVKLLKTPAILAATDKKTRVEK